jgi:hypothetical protein
MPLDDALRRLDVYRASLDVGGFGEFGARSEVVAGCIATGASRLPISQLLNKRRIT